MTKDEEKFCGGLTGLGWSDLLIRKPQEEKFCDKYNGWALMTGENWLELLKEQPKFRAKAEKYVNGIAALIALYPPRILLPHGKNLAAGNGKSYLRMPRNLPKSATNLEHGRCLIPRIGQTYCAPARNLKASLTNIQIGKI